MTTMKTTMTIIDVYAAQIPFETDSSEILPQARADDIAGCTDGGVRERRFYVWKLLETALRRSFGLNIGELDFKNENGKWSCSACEFSLSHSGNAVAVAVSDKPVGVDIELCDSARFEKLRDKILTAKEKENPENTAPETLGRRLNILWTVKEAAFKCGNEKFFIPYKTETDEVTRVTGTVRAGDREYFLTVVSSDAQSAVFKPINVIIE